MKVFIFPTSGWVVHDDCDPEELGLVPMFFWQNDPRKAVEQVDEYYAHGGGWRNFEGFALEGVAEEGQARLCYSVTDEEGRVVNDPPMKEIGRTILPAVAEGQTFAGVASGTEVRASDEMVIFFECSWCAVVQEDGSFVVARLD